MTVLLMPSAFSPHKGGVEELSLRLGQELTRSAREVLVLTNRWPADLPSHDTVEGLPVLRHPMRPYLGRRPTAWFRWVLARRDESRLVRGLRDRKVSLVHVQCVSSQAYLAAAIAERLSVPLVVTLQGELTMDATGLYDDPRTLRSWSRLLDRAHAVSGCSQFVIDEARARKPDLRADARAIPNGVHSEGAVPSTREPGLLFAVGRHVPQKGFDLLLRAVAELPTDVRLELAGDGSSRSELERLARELGIVNRVTFLGALPHEQVLARCAAASGFVLPSRHEPQGIVVLEAMAAGTPVFAAAVGGVPETVQDTVNGHLFRGGDHHDLVRVLREHLSADHRATVARARQTATAHAWPQIVAMYRELYDSAARVYEAERAATSPA